ncbi:hypothetical protein Ade02nite_19570 [Paractinoplanes deccanensis]|uniref:Uncharacterized protein n=1 Tax=Paractinoplanes deccanensis TaxID=113561 RepID=A0ABQ3XZZ1_9ACTN|nr:hypothetical protein [Actinoplanes deccanensis]GID73316.1 hypothetical protein Ade02nite_19570 [Actinoplanes deccanensis]
MESAKPKCSGKRSNGEPCTKWPMKGQRVCNTHGGSSPQAKAAAERRLRTANAEQAVVTFGLPREVDPRDALLEEVYRAAGVVDFLRDQVQKLTADEVVWGKAEEVEKQAGEFPGIDVTHKASVNVWVELYARERKHLVDVCKAAIQAGIEERKVRVAEQQGALLAGVIKAILGDLDLTPEQAARVPEVVPRHLRAVA